MNTRKPQSDRPILLLITDHATMQGDIVPIDVFIAANASDPDLCEDVRCLARGFGFTIGGGAAPAVSISRWS
jgi:hypothetical protein